MAAFVFVSGLLLIQPAGAAEYVVGDGSTPNGWDTGTNYASWAQTHSFAAGDVLVFEYVKSQHNVYEVTEAAYRSCDVSGAGDVLATYGTGYDKVRLAEARAYWFICQIPGHCMGGMKLAVNVSAGPPGGGVPASPSLPSAPSSSAPGGCRSLVAWGALVVLIASFGQLCWAS